VPSSQQQQRRLAGAPEFFGTERTTESLKVHFDLPADMGSPTATHIRLQISGPGLSGVSVTHAQLPESAATAPATSRRFNYTFPDLRPGCEYRIEVQACCGEQDPQPGAPLLRLEKTEPEPYRSFSAGRTPSR
jgi:hypothetical protein